MPKGDSSGEQERGRKTLMMFLVGYGGFLVGTVLIPIFPALGGVLFWMGVFGVFWAGWSSAQK